MKNIGIRILAALTLALLLALAATAAGETVISDAAALTALITLPVYWLVVRISGARRSRREQMEHHE